MHTYLKTRGTVLDYAFLVEAPAAKWWADVANWVDEERLGLVVRRRSGRADLLLNGIPSRRRDAQDTALRYSLVVNDVHEDARLAAFLIDAGLGTQALRALGRALDERFDEAFTDALLASDADGDSRAGADVREKVRAALREAASEHPVAEVVGVAGAAGTARADEPGSWAGPAGSADAVAAFRTRAHLLAGDPSGPPGRGYALTTRLPSSENGARAIAGAVGDAAVAVLLTGENSLEGIVGLGKAPHGGPEDLATPRRTDRPGDRTGWTIAAAVVVLAVVLLTLWVTAG